MAISHQLRPFLHHLYILFSHHGGLGLLVLGALDSSILFVPFGNDLLMIALSARTRILIPYYAVMATVGSMLGCLSIDLVVRKGGEKEIEKHVSRKRFEYIKERVNKDAAKALAFASLMPPPFPFTPFVAATSALQYPRRKFFVVIGVARLVRFSIDGALAIFVGKRLLKVAAHSAPFEIAIGVLILACVVGSIISVYRWISQSRSAGGKGGPAKARRAT
ncbi:MAG: VTT domain-containing protein [Terriglobia bacterium]